jgi:hypothetical protein
LSSARERFERALEEFDRRGPEVLEELRAAAEAHYRSEAGWLAGLPSTLRAKLAAQHAEALELIGALPGAAESDVPYLTRRLCALARHNLIEEERDVAPYYHRKI